MTTIASVQTDDVDNAVQKAMDAGALKLEKIEVNGEMRQILSDPCKLEFRWFYSGVEEVNIHCFCFAFSSLHN